jgi:Pescadillo N-terminus
VFSLRLRTFLSYPPNQKYFPRRFIISQIPDRLRKYCKYRIVAAAMGNRIKGRPKKSSIKAAISSKAGSKRKLSRMGKQRQKNKAGLDATFIGRSRCLTMLQINLKDFRRLCILKGIYPREPHRAPSKKKGQSYYHIKDIRAIAHEPVLQKVKNVVCDI